MRASVVTVGEAMLRLKAPGRAKLGETGYLEACIGGAELGVAVALTRLGVPAAWISKLPTNALGRMCAAEARRHGVDISNLAWTADARMGLYFVETGPFPRGSSVLYDRKASAASTLAPSDVDWASALDGANVLHTTGITCALSASCLASVHAAIDAARASGCRVSFDTNYRSQLWTPADARASVESLMPTVDLLFTSPTDASVLFGVGGEPADVAHALKNRYGVPVVVVSVRAMGDGGLASRGSVVLGDGLYVSTPIRFEVVDPFGAGDAFVAGFLFGLLTRDGDLGYAQACGDALAALKQTLPGEFATFTRDELEQALNEPSARVRR
jgi:2-dehydro-3-deoxygluconokinase